MRRRVATTIVLVVLLIGTGIVFVNVWPDQAYCDFLSAREWAGIFSNPHSYRAADELPPTLLPLTDARVPDRSRFTLLSTNQVREWGDVTFFQPAAVQADWTPSTAQIAALECSLPRVALLRSERYTPGARIRMPLQYFRQYLPVVVHGRRLIYVNALWLTDGVVAPRQLREGLEIGIDGGANFWQALFDPSTLEFVDLTTNGQP